MSSSLPGWKELPMAGVAFRPSTDVKTGEWRLGFRPVVKEERCVGCAMCVVLCPDMAMGLGEEGKAQVNYDYCKGCGICAKECPYGAIEMVPE
ncbi:pyruvate ferredoxin oxidoreductase [Candidatus Bathyarchaeota archaeon]|nr:MAG: pyruvate ferredoxin oxidoreductase [Candidatus Bathyarchaeota archaeon]